MDQRAKESPSVPQGDSAHRKPLGRGCPTPDGISTALRVSTEACEVLGFQTKRLYGEVCRAVPWCYQDTDLLLHLNFRLGREETLDIQLITAVFLFNATTFPQKERIVK